VIAVEPLERRLRHEELEQQGLEDYAQWIARLRAGEHITEDEAEMLRAAREATIRVISVDDFSPGQLTNMPLPSKNRASKTGTVKKKTAGDATAAGGKKTSAVKKAAVKKSRKTKKQAGK
jgi:hypothetical protein